jgi:hypothetical protein
MNSHKKARKAQKIKLNQAALFQNIFVPFMPFCGLTSNGGTFKFSGAGGA